MEKENVDFVVCKICGAKRRILTQHIKIKHNLSKSEYIEKYKSPIVCKARQDIQVERNKELNKMLSTDEYYIELMKKVRHNNALLPQVVEAKLVKWDEYLHSDLNRERSRQRMLDEEHQKKCTDGKLKSQKFHEQKSLHMSKMCKEHWDDEEWKSNHLSNMYDGSKKEYKDKHDNIVLFRSTWELSLYEYLEENNIKYSYESLQIQYRTEDGNSHTYYPDFYLEDLNLVLEVKPQKFTTNKVNQIKKNVTENLGYKFKFVTEKELKDLNSFFHNL